ncbi:MAG: hypothetical protein IT292_09870 [Deltaproteobacteria bacterium]|nr:hypothetical protein [Deltaproteobacteria bacterium]
MGGNIVFTAPTPFGSLLVALEMTGANDAIFSPGPLPLIGSVIFNKVEGSTLTAATDMHITGNFTMQPGNFRQFDFTNSYNMRVDDDFTVSGGVYYSAGFDS